MNTLNPKPSTLIRVGQAQIDKLNTTSISLYHLLQVQDPFPPPP